jgi:hypothetical protein
MLKIIDGKIMVVTLEQTVQKFMMKDPKLQQIPDQMQN